MTGFSAVERWISGLHSGFMKPPRKLTTAELVLFIALKRKIKYCGIIEPIYASLPTLLELSSKTIDYTLHAA
jgi:hypothetical protein